MLGQGVYKLSEVSRLTDLHQSRVWSWFKSHSDGMGSGPVFESDYEPVEEDYAVSFLDLIDVLVASQFRDQFHVSMQVIRKAYKLLKKELEVRHPFCHSDLYTDGKRIFNLAATQLGKEKLSDILSHQQFFSCIKKQLDHIDYGRINKLATRWRICNGVVIDPMVCVGKPTLENTGLTTFVITNQYYANKNNLALVADLYDISEKEVVNAVKFEEWYRRLVA